MPRFDQFTSALKKTAAPVALLAFYFSHTHIPVISESPLLHKIFRSVPARVQHAAGNNAADYCATIDGEGLNAAINKRVLDLRDQLQNSKTGTALVDSVRAYPDGTGWICFVPAPDGIIKNEATAYYSSGTVVLPDVEGTDDSLLMAVHEIRHLDRSIQSLRRPAMASKIEREARTLYSEADANAVGRLVLWELDQNDNGHRLEKLFAYERSVENTNPDDKTKKIRYSDITATFMQHAAQNDAPPITALRAAFHRWFYDADRFNNYRDGAISVCFLDRVACPDQGGAQYTYLNEQVTLIPVPNKTLREKFSAFGDIPAYKTNYLRAGRGFANLLMRQDDPSKTSAAQPGVQNTHQPAEPVR